jgi:hypothetical protein
VRGSEATKFEVIDGDSTERGMCESSSDALDVAVGELMSTALL